MQLRQHKRVLCHLMVALIGIMIASYASTIPFAPLHWLDEVTINEIGRGGIVNKTTDWSMCLFGPDNLQLRQSWAVYYLGGLLQEFGYQSFGHCGPRIMALSGLVCATCLLGVYVFRKTGTCQWGYLMSLMFATCPLIAQSVRGGRADIYAFAVLFLCLNLCLRIRSRICFCLCFIIGFVAVSLFFWWITAIFTLPIVCWEIVEQCRENQIQFKDELRVFLFCAFGGIVAAMILFSPFLLDDETTCQMFENVMNISAGASSRANRLMIREFVMGALLSFPGIMLVGVVGALIPRKNVLLSLGLLGFVVISVKTNVYAWRIIYFIPYALVGIMLLWQSIRSEKWRKVVLVCVCMMVCAQFAYCVVARTALDWVCRPYRDYKMISNLMAKHIPRGAYVYNADFSLYYIGRALGWHQYRNHPLTVPNEKIASKCEYFLFSGTNCPPVFASLLSEKGFKTKAVVYNPVQAKQGTLAWGLKDGPLHPLGPYCIYSKDKIGDQ